MIVEHCNALRGWVTRMETWLSREWPTPIRATRCSWAIFRPSRDVRAALDAVSVTYPQLVRGVLDFLDHTEKMFDLAMLKPSARTAANLATAVADLRDRVAGALTVIEARSAAARRAKGSVGERLLRLARGGESYTSSRKLGVKLSVTSTAIQNAIGASDELRTWAGTTKERRKPQAVPLTRIVAETIPQTREKAEITDDDVDVIFARLLDEARPAERARLHILDAERRRSLVETFAEHERDFEPAPDVSLPKRKRRLHKRL